MCVGVCVCLRVLQAICLYWADILTGFLIQGFFSHMVGISSVFNSFESVLITSQNLKNENPETLVGVLGHNTVIPRILQVGMIGQNH